MRIQEYTKRLKDEILQALAPGSLHTAWDISSLCLPFTTISCSLFSPSEIWVLEPLLAGVNKTY